MKELLVTEYLATIDLATVAPGVYPLGVDDCRDGAIVDTVFSVPYSDEDSLRARCRLGRDPQRARFRANVVLGRSAGLLHRRRPAATVIEAAAVDTKALSLDDLETP